MIRVGHFNARGLEGKENLIAQFAKMEKIDVMFVVETWMKPRKVSIINTVFLDMRNWIEDEVYQGGRRSPGGILAFCDPALRSSIRVAYEDPNKHFAIIEMLDWIIGIAYFPPSVDHQLIFDFMDAVKERAGDGKFVIVGDLNARMGRYSEDSARNTRGRLMVNDLEARQWMLQKPIRGRYTSYGPSGGAGITDIVISATDIVKEYVVHSAESLGGSDHRPLHFSIQPEQLPAKSFERWNIRLLAKEDVREKYWSHLRDTCEPLKLRLGSVKTRILRNGRDGNTQEEIDGAWEGMREWIEGALNASCKRLRFETRAGRKDFWTEELLEEQRNIIEQGREYEELVRNRSLPEDVRNAARQLLDLNHNLLDNLKRRKETLFESTVNNLGDAQNVGGFLKMVSCKKAQRERSGCKLDPGLIEVHAGHFSRTFGREPEGQYEEGEEVESPTIEELSGERLEKDMVKRGIEQLALGKAAGIDGLMAECLLLGRDVMVDLMTAFLNLCYSTGFIPGEWKQALIAPVFKKKGSDQDAANYRPIALTCIARKLYERMLLMDINPFVDKLSDFQGGFRRGRSTLDQVFCLQEVISHNPQLVNIFLDFQAAYDMVDRRILWKTLRDEFGLPETLIYRLQHLFDHNSSQLVVLGRRSEAMENKRGLLQGSSLSPILFNFFINSLIVRLEALPKVLTNGVPTNALFFADDGNLHARTWDAARALLKICEEWSIEVGMRFAPTKCLLLKSPRMERGERDEPLRLYGLELPEVDVATYLGIPFTANGIDWGRLRRTRTGKAKGVISLLCELGMNANGWTTYASAQVFRMMVRPVMEYGVALKVLSVKEVRDYQKTQDLALRTIFSAPAKTSAHALHKLTLMEPFPLRNKLLHLSFSGRLHNSKDSSVPAVNLWWNGLRGKSRKSLATASKRNSLWGEGAWLNHSQEIRRKGGDQGRKPFGKEKRNLIIRERIMKMDEGKRNVAGVIQVELGDKMRHTSQPWVWESKKQRITITRWLIGAVARHQVCRGCEGGEILSRDHAVECSGAKDRLVEVYVNHLDPNSQLTCIDQLLNKFRKRPPDHQFYRVLETVIGRIYERCLQWRQKENGFWVEEEEVGRARWARVGAMQRARRARQGEEARGQMEGDGDPFIGVQRLMDGDADRSGVG